MSTSLKLLWLAHGLNKLIANYMDVKLRLLIMHYVAANYGSNTMMFLTYTFNILRIASVSRLPISVSMPSGGEL